MTAAEQLLRSIVAWATRDANVRCLVLVGSRARAAPPDDLADIDLQVYGEASEPYARDEAWLLEIGRIWLCVRDEYADGDVSVPTRLVIFEGGVKVDFAFYPAGNLSNGVREGLAHRILLDKDPSTRHGAATSVSSRERHVPSEAEFRGVVEEFWFETYHVATYLARNELWLAKARDWAAKQFLLRMIDWHEQTTRGRVHDAGCAGRHMWVSEDTWAALHHAFAGFEREESWGAALATISLFQRLATDTAATLGFLYPVGVDENISRFILGLRDASLANVS